MRRPYVSMQQFKLAQGLLYGGCGPACGRELAATRVRNGDAKGTRFSLRLALGELFAVFVLTR